VRICSKICVFRRSRSMSVECGKTAGGPGSAAPHIPQCGLEDVRGSQVAGGSTAYGWYARLPPQAPIPEKVLPVPYEAFAARSADRAWGLHYWLTRGGEAQPLGSGGALVGAE
jgi:hypothetical protein